MKNMCGIFGYQGDNNAKEVVFQGLKKLEYRGYDSWGIAVLHQGKIYLHKNIGEVKKDSQLSKIPISHTAIGHTRWATHGGVTKINAHPHQSLQHNFCIVQNGMVDNFDDLKRKLISQKYRFLSQTDTEVIVKIIEREMSTGIGLEQSIKKMFALIKGRNTIAVLDSKTNTIYAVKNGSPLVVGRSDHGVLLASDYLSIADQTNDIATLQDWDMIKIQNQEITVINIKNNNGKNLDSADLLKTYRTDHKYEKVDKNGHKHFMIKEIFEQQKTIINASNYTRKDLEPLIKAIKKSRRVYVIGAGTAGLASGQIAFFLRNIAKIDAQDLRSYEYQSYLPIINNRDFVIAVSQSGETADTLEALEDFRNKGCQTCSIVNMIGTTMSLLSDFEYYTNAGAEICVASTKAFTAQISWGYLVSMTLVDQMPKAKKLIKAQAQGLQNLFSPKSLNNIKNICNKLIDHEHFFVLGKSENQFVALEAALKVKEISYKHFEGFSAGELKHGVLALVEKNTPVFTIMTNQDQDIISASSQVKSRGAQVIGIGNKLENNQHSSIFDHYIEVTQSDIFSASITNVVPFQLISYYLAVKLKRNIDKPRNLAKSVTVK